MVGGGGGRRAQDVRAAQGVHGEAALDARGARHVPRRIAAAMKTAGDCYATPNAAPGTKNIACCICQCDHVYWTLHF